MVDIITFLININIYSLEFKYLELKRINQLYNELVIDFK